MVQTTLKKAEDSFGYKGLKAPDKIRKQKIEGSVAFEWLGEILKGYEEVLKFDTWWMAVGAARKVNAALTPEQIGTFLLTTAVYKEHRNYSNNTGYFITRLVQTSYNHGFNKFELNTKALPKKINNIGWSLKGKKSRLLELCVDGDVGNCYGAYGRYLSLKSNGDSEDWCGYKARHCVFKTSNIKVLEMLKEYLKMLKGNKVYFINPDGSEVCVEL